MCVYREEPVPELSEEKNENLVDRLIAVSGARQADRITVAGRKGLDVLLGLCRRGFLHATCRTGAEGPHVSDNCADCLWILNPQNTAEMRTLLASCGRDLRTDGTLVIGLWPETDPLKSSRLADLLAQCGFASVHQAHAAGRDVLLCARKRMGRALAA